MNVRAVVRVGTLVCASALAGCGGSAAAAKTETVYTRLGERAGIAAVVKDFLAAVVADPKINGYFLNSSVNQEHLGDCLTDQIASATGGPEKYGCKSMKAAHADLGISSRDFDDLVANF